MFCETFDEPAHVAAGMEWLDRGTYVSDIEHPPLARIAIGVGPTLAGIPSANSGSFVVDGNIELYHADKYWRNLSLARAGVLPFFVIAVLLVAAWARSLGGDVAGIAAAALFSNEPNVLAHAGLATTDMAAVTGTVAVAYLVHRWLARDSSDFRFAMLFGAVTGLALLCKFSLLLFLPAVVIALIVVHRRLPRRFVSTCAIGAVVAVVVIWAGYRFSFGSMSDLGPSHSASQRGFAFAIPAPELAGGIMTVADHAKRGHGSWLFGEYREHGWWYYFPVVIVLKTTIGFLALVVIAAWRQRDGWAPLAAGLAIVIVSMPVSINIGVRHVLPAYPFFAIAAGLALARSGKWVRGGALAAALLPSLVAHPDYIPYFNAFAGREPERIVVDSNLDWGQDLERLSRELRRRNVKSVALAYAGNAEPDRHRLPKMRRVDPTRYTPGWLAVSEVLLRSRDGRYAWLQPFKPVTKIGGSMKLYYLPPLDGQLDDDVSRVLLPVGCGQSVWQCELTIANSGDRAVSIRAADRIVATIAPGQTVVNPAMDIGDARNGALLFVPREDAGAIHFALTLRAPSGERIAVPVVRDRDARSSALHFPAVPTQDGSRATLRIYDLTGNATEARVRLNDVAVSTTLTRRHADDRDLTIASRTLDSLFSTIPQPRVAVSVEVDSKAFWAFITVTDATGTHVILPD